jgi:phospholipase/lecithinase/hemolysin
MKGTKKQQNTTDRSGAWQRTGFRNKLGTMAALACFALLINTSPAKSPYPDIRVFGDSMSDTGNFFAATGIPPAPYYWEGRMSNGQIWLEYLAAKLQIPFDQAHNYAWIGSLTGDTNFRDGVGETLYPGFEQQIDAFLAEVGAEGADPDTLYVVWIGANDIFDWLGKGMVPPVDELVATGVGNTVQGIMELANAGARHFIVGNVPDLGITPDGQPVGPLLSGLSYAYNQALEEHLVALECGLGLFITRLDSYDYMNQIAANPEAFGMVNVTDEALMSPGADPSEYLFWDGVHPTTAAHEWLADFVCAALVRTYAPPKARGRGPTNPHALHGLVRAATRRSFGNSSCAEPKRSAPSRVRGRDKTKCPVPTGRGSGAKHRR